MVLGWVLVMGSELAWGKELAMVLGWGWRWSWSREWGREWSWRGCSAPTGTTTPSCWSFGIKRAIKRRVCNLSLWLGFAGLYMSTSLHKFQGFTALFQLFPSRDAGGSQQGANNEMKSHDVTRRCCAALG